MFDAGLWFAGLAALAVFTLAGWAVSVPLRNVSIVDGLWSLMFVLAAATYALAREEALGSRAALVLVLVSAWAIRLSVYITWRNRGHGEDFRYQKIRARNEPNFAFKSLYLVFGLQAVLAWVISLPLLVAIHSDAPLGWLDIAGVALWVVGLVLEAGGAWSIVGPVLMSVLLLKVSGVALLEKDIGERRPAYRDYVRRTNAFFPGPPRAA